MKEAKNPGGQQRIETFLTAILESMLLFIPSLDLFSFDSTSITGLCAQNNWILKFLKTVTFTLLLKTLKSFHCNFFTT